MLPKLCDHVTWIGKVQSPSFPESRCTTTPPAGWDDGSVLYRKREFFVQQEKRSKHAPIFPCSQNYAIKGLGLAGCGVHHPRFEMIPIVRGGHRLDSTWTPR